MPADNTISTWPIVHARTQFLDFRPLLLARPPWLTDPEFEWIKRHVSPDRKSGAEGSSDFGARAFPETLRDPGGERWIYLRKDDLVVFGVLAMATTLSVVAPAMTHEMKRVRDKTERGRALDAFVGFAFRPLASEARCFLPARDLDPYQRAYEACLRPRWDETIDHAGWLQPAPSQEFAVPGEWCSFDLACDDVADAGHATIRVFPRTEDARLWRIAATGRRPVSLVIGMPGVRYASSCAFDIATSADVSKPQTFERPKAMPPKVEPDERRHSDGARGAGDEVRGAAHRDASDAAPYPWDLPPRDPAREPPRKVPSEAPLPRATRRPSKVTGLIKDLWASGTGWIARSIRGQDAPRPPHKSTRDSSDAAQEWQGKGKSKGNSKGKDS